MPLTACRLVGWKTPKNGDWRPHTECSVEDYKATVEKMENACEYMMDKPCRVYLDWDKIVPVADCYDAPKYMERNEMRSVKEQIAEHLKKAPLLFGKPYTLLCRDPRLIDKDNVKFSYRIIFPELITADHTKIKEYLVACGYKNNEPFDLSPYDRQRIINAVYCCKPDTPNYPLRPYYAFEKDMDVSRMLITAYDDSLPMIKWDEWMPKVEKVVEKPVVESEEVDGDVVKKVKVLLGCISADCGYAEWLEILMAVKSSIGDCDEAYDLADEWSATAKSYDSRVFGRTWSSIRDLSKYSIGTLIYHAKKQNPEKFKAEYSSVFSPKYGFDDLRKMKDYSQMKRIFETRVCKVKDSIRYIYKDDVEVRTMTRKALKETYENLNCLSIDEKGKETSKSFIDRWLKDGEMREYERALTVPPPLIIPKGVLNLWTPFEWEKEMEVVGGSTDIIHEHMRLITGYDEEVYQHFVKMIAFKLQMPAHKTNVMIVITSEEGTGKSLLFNAFERLFGEQKCIDFSAPEKDLFGTFAYKWADKQMVLLNDFNPAELKRENSERMKALITETNITLERKGIDQFETKQYCQFIAFSNSMAPVPINNGSRRYWMFSASSAKKGDASYFKGVADWMEKDENIKAWYDELMAMKLDDFVPWKFPLTEAMEIAKASNMNPTEMFMADKKKDIIQMIEYKKKSEKGYIRCKEEEAEVSYINHNALYNKYRMWSASSGFSAPSFNIHKRKFQAEIYKRRNEYGLEYSGDSSHPERTAWIIKEKEKWVVDENEEEEDGDSEEEL